MPGPVGKLTTLLPLAARTATVNCPIKDNFRHRDRWAAFLVHLTVPASGLKFKVFAVDEGAVSSGTLLYYALNDLANTAITAAGDYIVFLGANRAGVAGSIVLNIALPLPSRYTLQVVHLDATPVSYGVQLLTGD